MGRYGAPLKLLAIATSLAISNLRFGKAYLLLEARRYADCLAELQRIAPDGMDAPWWKLFGRVQLLLSDYAAMAEAGAALLYLDPDDGFGHYLLGCTHLKAAAYRDARTHFEQAMREESTFAAGATGMVHYYIKRQDFARAIEMAERACDREPGDVHVMVHLAMAYHFGRRPEAAKAMIAAALAIDPELPFALETAALIEEGRGELTDGLALRRMALSAEPTHGRVERYEEAARRSEQLALGNVDERARPLKLLFGASLLSIFAMGAFWRTAASLAIAVYLCYRISEAFPHKSYRERRDGDRWRRVKRARRFSYYGAVYELPGYVALIAFLLTEAGVFWSAAIVLALTGYLAILSVGIYLTQARWAFRVVLHVVQAVAAAVLLGRYVTGWPLSALHTVVYVAIAVLFVIALLLGDERDVEPRVSR